MADKVKYKSTEYYSYGWTDRRYGPSAMGYVEPRRVVPSLGDMVWPTEAENRGYCMQLFGGKPIIIQGIYHWPRLCA